MGSEMCIRDRPLSIEINTFSTSPSHRCTQGEGVPGAPKHLPQKYSKNSMPDSMPDLDLNARNFFSMPEDFHNARLMPVFDLNARFFFSMPGGFQ